VQHLNERFRDSRLTQGRSPSGRKVEVFYEVRLSGLLGSSYAGSAAYSPVLTGHSHTSRPPYTRGPASCGLLHSWISILRDRADRARPRPVPLREAPSPVPPAQAAHKTPLHRPITPTARGRHVEFDLYLRSTCSSVSGFPHERRVKVHR
jgi:hypothetical protein